MTVLCWRHHTLIQALLLRGPLKEDDLRSLFSSVAGKNPGSREQLFNDYLRKINMELSYVQFELRAFRNQYDGNVYYGVVNNVADEQSKLGTKYTVPQIAFYKGVIEKIVQESSGQGSISNIEALYVRLENQAASGTGTGSESQNNSCSQVPTAFKNFSASQKEKTIEELVRDKWLVLTEDGNIGLGVRSFLDLRSWFHNNEIPSCDVCNEAAVKADLCPNESCSVRIHNYCLKQKFSQARAERVCPGCGKEWPYTFPKAELIEDSETQQPAPNNIPLRKKRGRSQTGGESETVRLNQASAAAIPPQSDSKSNVRRTSARLRSGSS